MLIPSRFGLNGQSAPGKSSQAIPDEQQRGGIFGSGENKGAESGQAGDNNSGAGDLQQVRANPSHLLHTGPLRLLTDVSLT